MSISRFWRTATFIVGLAIAAPAAYAGPFILAGTDADDHGSTTGTANQNGWLFMQKVLENLAPGVTNGNKVVVSLGANPAQKAGFAAASAYQFAALPAGWSFLSVDTASAVTAFLTGTGAGTIGAAGIIMLDSSFINVSGGLDSAELSALTTNAGAINSFLGGGGGLFSQANGYGWLTALLPSVTVTGESTTGIALTAAGNTAFPALTNADLSSGPYHEVFGNVGALSILGASTNTSNAVIVGSSGGSITAPDPVSTPEPATIALLGAGLFGLGAARRRRNA